MRMEHPFRMSLPIERSLMESHGVGEGYLEQVVVTCGDQFQDIGEGRRFGGGQLCEARQSRTMSAEQYLEGPDRPEWDEGGEVIVRRKDAVFTFVFLADVIG